MTFSVGSDLDESVQNNSEKSELTIQNLSKNLKKVEDFLLLIAQKGYLIPKTNENTFVICICI